MAIGTNDMNFIKFMGSITNRTVDFLKTEIKMSVTGIQNDCKEVPDVKLNDLTVLISLVIPKNNISISFSFDQSLINEIFEEYCLGLDIDTEEANEYMKETADDMINIIVGNTIPNIPKNKSAIHMTPPMIISNARSISAKKSISFFVNELSTIHGSMKIICAISNDMYSEKFI